MATNAQINILINAAQSAKTLGDLDKALGDINAELKKVEIGSDAFNTLKKASDDTAKSINQLNISGFDKQLKGFEATSKTISSSLGFATGAMALFGVESEETQKALARVQGALAISTAFKDFSEAQKAANESGKGLNQTLLKNPFILIAALLLPLVAQMDSFKEIMATLSGVAGELFKAIKPLIDAFMMLLNSVFKALVPIINTLAQILIKALRPIMDVIVKVLDKLNPLFEELGQFLSENTVLIDLLTGALELALLPLTLLMDGLEALGVIEPTGPADALDATAQSAEEAAAQVDNVVSSMEALQAAADEKTKTDEREIQLLEAKGVSERELDTKRRASLKRQIEDNKTLLKQIDLQIASLQALGIDTTKLTEFRTKVNTRLQDSIFKLDLFEAGIQKKASDRAKQQTEDLKRRADDLQKAYLAQRDILRRLNEEVVSEENEKYLGFFVDFRKNLEEIIGTIPEATRPAFQNFLNFFSKTFKTPNAFSEFVKKYKADSNELLDGTDEVASLFVKFGIRLNDVLELTKKTAEGIGGDAVASFETIRDVIAKTQTNIVLDAIVFDREIQSALARVGTQPENTLQFLASFFSQNIERAKSFFDFTQGQLTISFDLLKDEIDKQLKEIDVLLQGQITITQRERLKAVKEQLFNFLNEYRTTLKSFSQEDIEALIEVPLQKVLPAIFDELRRGSNDAVISVEKLRESLTFTENFDEFIRPVRDSLINLGLSAEQVQKAIDRVIFKLNDEFLNTLERRLREEADAISTNARQREKLLRRASEVRIEILRDEIRRAEKLSDDELKRYTDVVNKRVAVELQAVEKLRREGKISDEDAANQRADIIAKGEQDIKDNRIKLATETSTVIKGINRDIDNEIKLEAQRRLEDFAETFIEITGYIQQAGQITADILTNLSQQQLTNLQANFEAQVAQIEALKNQGLITQREFDFERIKAQEKYEQKRKQIEKAAWERNYAIQIGQAIANTAIAVTSALAQFPGPPATIPASIIAGVLGGAQVAVIASQPKPRFARGGLVGGNAPGDADTVMSALSSGEFVMNANATKRFLPLLKQLNQYDLPTIGQRQTVASPPITDLGAKEPIRAYVVLDELNEKNEVLNRIQNENSFFRTS